MGQYDKRSRKQIQKAYSCLIKVTRSSLKDRELRELLYDTQDGRQRKKITSGGAQGSILGILNVEMSDDY